MKSNRSILATRTHADAHASACRFAESEPLLLAAEQYLLHLSGRPRTPDGVDLRKSVLESLVRLYTGLGRPDERTRWQQRLDTHSTSPPVPGHANP